MTTIVPATEAVLMNVWTVKVPFFVVFYKDFIFMLISITAVVDIAGTPRRKSQLWHDMHETGH